MGIRPVPIGLDKPLDGFLRELREAVHGSSGDRLKVLIVNEVQNQINNTNPNAGIPDWGAIIDGIIKDPFFIDLGKTINLIDAPLALEGSVNRRINDAISSLQNLVLGKVHTFWQDDPPMDNEDNNLQVGDIWFDTNDGNHMYRWNGSAWVSVVDDRLGEVWAGWNEVIFQNTTPTTAFAQRIASLSATVATKVKTYNQATAPTGTLTVGDLWFDSAHGNKPFRWDGTQWVDATDSRLMVADAAISEVATANVTPTTAFAQKINQIRAAITFKNKQFFQNDPPTSSSDYALTPGDVWVDTNDGNKGYRWDGSSWQPTTDTRIETTAAAISEIGTASANPTTAAAQKISDIRAVSNSKNKTFFQNDAPASTSTYQLQPNDLWFDTDDGFKPYRWTGSAWSETTDARVSGTFAAITEIANAVSSPTTAAAQRIQSINAQVGAHSAQIANKEEAKVGYCSLSNYYTKATCQAAGGTWVDQPFATAVKQVAITVGGQTAAIEQTMQAVTDVNNQLAAQYFVKVQYGSTVSGFGLANDATGSRFYIQADKFAIAPPGTGVDSPDCPFVVSGGSVYLKQAAIGNYISSTNYDGNTSNPSAYPGSTGWCISRNGEAAFNSVIVRNGGQIGNNSLAQAQFFESTTMRSGTSGSFDMGRYYFKAGYGKTTTVIISVDCSTSLSVWAIDLLLNGNMIWNPYYKNGQTIESRFASGTRAFYWIVTTGYLDITVNIYAGGGTFGQPRVSVVEVIS